MHVSETDVVDDQARPLILRRSLPADRGSTLTGRPFSPEAAEAEFSRLMSRGETLIRFVIPWKALEHEGPGIYDEEYLAYLRKILLAAEWAGVMVCLCPRQDGWRPDGGDAQTEGSGDGQIVGDGGQERLREQYLACLRHGYRRLKNCKAITEWSLLYEQGPVLTDAAFCTGFARRLREVNPEIRVFIEDTPDGHPAGHANR